MRGVDVSYDRRDLTFGIFKIIIVSNNVTLLLKSQVKPLRMFPTLILY